MIGSRLSIPLVIVMALLLLVALSSSATFTHAFVMTTSTTPTLSSSFSSSASSRRTTTTTPNNPLKASNVDERIPLRCGSSVALITPFNNESGGSVDFNALRRLLRYHVDSETDNLCILGTTGEASVLSMSEREAILKVVVDEVKGVMPILVGTGTINPKEVKEMTLQAMDLGCDASLVVTPYYVKPPQRALIQHFTTAADLGMPVIIYNVPGRTGVNFLDENIALCAQHENIVGVKDATGDMDRVANLRSLVGKDDDFLLYSGDDGTCADFCLRGGDGCISVTANVAARTVHDMVRAARAGDAQTTKTLDATVSALNGNLFLESNPIPAKWAAKRIGLIDDAYCRPPLDTMDPKFESQLEDSLRQAGLL